MLPTSAWAAALLNIHGIKLGMTTPNLDQEQEKAVALAGLFQSAALVQGIARTGESDKASFQALMTSIFTFDADGCSEVYGGINGVKFGIDALLQVLKNKQAQQYADSIRYTISILQVEKLLRRSPDINQILRSRLEQAANQMAHFDGVTDPAITGKLNDIYLDSLAKLKFRIQVNGSPEHLQNQQNAAKIRACLLAGVRSAMLWRQLGGTRIQLAFGRRKLIKCIDSLLELAQIS